MGLDASEIVVRGGRLSEPMLFGNLFVAEGGKRFLKLRKTHEGLCRFLTGKGSYSSPLAVSSVFETLRVRRNEAIEALVAEAFDGGADEGQGSQGCDNEVDGMAALGVDDAAAFEAPAVSRRLKRRRWDWALGGRGSKFVTVGLEPEFEFLILVESSSSMPSIEVTASSRKSFNL